MPGGLVDLSGDAAEHQPPDAVTKSTPKMDALVKEGGNAYLTAADKTAIPLQSITNAASDLSDADKSGSLSMTGVKARIQHLSVPLSRPIKTPDGKGLIEDGFGKEFHVGVRIDIFQTC